MATHTPNYNLSKPESTDDMTDFFADYGDNMNIIDINMGGNANHNIADDYDDTLTYSVGDYVIYNGLLYKCDTAVTTAETFDPTKWTHVVVTDEMGSGGGSGSLDAVETTSNAYAQLPQTDKDDPTKIFFLNDTQSSEVETPVDFSTIYNRRESSMNIAVVNGELVYTWNGGSLIGGSSYYPTAIPANAKKIKFKITTGNSYSTDNNRFKIAIGVKANYSTSTWATSADNDWLAVDIQNTRNTVYEGEIDLSGVNVPSYLMIGAHGWTVTFNEISIVSDAEPTGYTEIRYKDVVYGNGSSSSGHNYSTNEQVIGTWIDGKPLYEKTLHIVEGTEQTTKIYTTEITDLNAEYIKLESAEVKFGAMGGNAWYTAPFYDSGSYNMTVGVSKTQMTITSNGWKYTEANVTVRYTKTTD